MSKISSLITLSLSLCLLFLNCVCLTCVSFLMKLLFGFALSTKNLFFVWSPSVVVFQCIFIFSLCLLPIFSLCSSSSSLSYLSTDSLSLHVTRAVKDTFLCSCFCSLSSLFAHIYNFNLYLYLFIFKHLVKTCTHTSNERYQQTKGVQLCLRHGFGVGNQQM